MNYIKDKDYLNHNRLIEILKNINENSLLVVEKLQKIKDKVLRPKEGESLKILTSQQVEVLLDISQATMKRLIQDGILPARKIVSRYYFYEKDIHKLLQPQNKEDENNIQEE